MLAELMTLLTLPLLLLGVEPSYVTIKLDCFFIFIFAFSSPVVSYSFFSCNFWPKLLNSQTLMELYSFLSFFRLFVMTTWISFSKSSRLRAWIAQERSTLFLMYARWYSGIRLSKIYRQSQILLVKSLILQQNSECLAFIFPFKMASLTYSGS